MNQRIVSSLTAVLVASALGISPSSYAQEALVEDGSPEAGVPPEVTPGDITQPSDTFVSDARVPGNQVSELSAPEFSTEAEETVKVGEYQSQPESLIPPIAVIHAHVMDGRPAATVYVDGIPVLTFFGDEAAQATPAPSPDASVLAPDLTTPPAATAGTNQLPDQAPDAASGVKVAATKSDPLKPVLENSPDANVPAAELPLPQPSPEVAIAPETQVDVSDPVQRATAIAARINQLHREGFDASEINAEWDEDSEQYIITAGEDVLIEFDDDTMLPDTTENPVQDVLQAANRLRRELGGAEPLNGVEGAPQSQAAQIAAGPVQFSFSGLASWYGPGFHGRRSASGEVFNQNALTAAHRSLPFGTMVRVTNMNTGASVMVRINDRGPFGGGRVLDLSAGAARAIGLMQAGVGPVRVDVVGSR